MMDLEKLRDWNRPAARTITLRAGHKIRFGSAHSLEVGASDKTTRVRMIGAIQRGEHRRDSETVMAAKNESVPEQEAVGITLVTDFLVEHCFRVRTSARHKAVEE